VRIAELEPEQRGNWVIGPYTLDSGTGELQVEVAFPLVEVSGPRLRAIWPQPCIRQLKQSCVE
jgi:hypothetical protein